MAAREKHFPKSPSSFPPKLPLFTVKGIIDPIQRGSMVFLIFALALIFSIQFVYFPLLRYQEAKNRQAFAETYRAFKMRRVRRHYQFLSHLSPMEIEEDYNLDRAYHTIGKRYRN
jgi:hypothetical protein